MYPTDFGSQNLPVRASWKRNMNHAMDHALHASRFLSRRRLLQIGGLGTLGLSLSKCFEAEARGAGPTESVKNQRIQSCIVLYYYGGPSHLDTWDMKPGAPKEVRGEFKLYSHECAGHSRLRAHAALRPDHEQARRHPQHASPHAQPQFGCRRILVRPHSPQGRPGIAE